MKITIKKIITYCFLLLILTMACLSYRLLKEKNCLSIDYNLSKNFNSALLIGFRWETQDASTYYRTLWIVPEKDGLKIKNEKNFIIVPCDKLFWKVESLKYNFTNTKDYLEYIQAHPINETFSPDIFEYKFSTYQTKLNFIDKNTAAVTTYATHKIKDTNIINKNCNILPLTQLKNYKNIENTIKFYDTFDEDSLKLINKYRNKKIKDGAYLIDTTDGSNWCIERNCGKWIPCIAKTFKSLNNSTDYILYTTDLKLPKNIVSFNELCTDFSNIKKLFPGATDAISSPSKDLLGVFVENKLKLYLYSNNTIGNELLNIELKPGEKMIMCQWTSGSSIEQWSKQISTVK